MVIRSPRVSIGLPVYNGEKYLSAAIESLLAQSFPDVEIIISDNASTDETQAICRQFGSRDRRIHYHRNSQNIGAAANFNLTFRLASGEYFKWAAHDDLCAPELLTRCVEALDRDAGVVLAYPKAKIIGTGSEELEPYTVKLPTDSPDPCRRFAALLRGHKCYEIFGLIRRDVLAMTPLMGNYAHGDGVLLARLALLGRFEEIPEYLFFPRRHAGQSVAMLGLTGGPSSKEYARHAAWFDPKHAETMVFPYWRMHFEFFRSIHMARLTWFDCLRCYRNLAGKIYARRRLLLEDASFQIRRLVGTRKGDVPLEAG